MNTQTQDDLKLFKKAKRRINAMLIFSYLLLGLWNVAIYFLLTQPLFERPHSFLMAYLTSMLAQMILGMMIFFGLSEGKPKLRILLILGILAQVGWCGWLIYELIQSPDFILLYVIWFAMELIIVFYLLWLRGWMSHSWWARIYFDHTIVLEDDEEAEVRFPYQNQTNLNQPSQQTQPQFQQGYPQNVQQMAYQGQTPYQAGTEQGQTFYPGSQQGYPNPSQYNVPPQAQQVYYQNGYPNAGINGGYYVPNQSQGTVRTDNVNPPYGNPYPNSPSQQQPYPQNPYYDQGSAYSTQSSQAYPYQENEISKMGLGNDEGYAYKEENYLETGPVTPASSFAGNPDFIQQELYEHDGDDEKEEAPRKFSFFKRKPQEEFEAQFTQDSPIDFQGDQQLEARNQRERERREYKDLSKAYSQMAIRIAAVVYGELVLFPILMNIFQNHFVSINTNSVFAINLMFTLCILSAVVWTLPIFFLYLKQPGVKKILWVAAILQIGIAAFGLWMLHGYYTSPTVHYADSVYTYFLMSEVVRYGLLVAGVLPAFQLPEIRETWHELDDEEINGSDIVLELVEEEDPDEDVYEEEDDDQDNLDTQNPYPTSQQVYSQQPRSSQSQAKPMNYTSQNSLQSQNSKAPTQENINKATPSASFLEVDDVMGENDNSSTQV